MIDAARLRELLSWKQTGSALSRSTSLEGLSELLEGLDHELHHEPSVPYEEAIQGMYSWIVEATRETSVVALSDALRLSGAVERTELFSLLLDARVIPEGSDFGSISPGGSDVSVDASHVTMQRVGFEGADLRCVDLTKADLSGASLAGAWLPDAKHFSGATMTSVNLERAIVPSYSWIERLASNGAEIGTIADEYEVTQRCEVLYDADRGQQFEGDCEYTVERKRG